MNLEAYKDKVTIQFDNESQMGDNCRNNDRYIEIKSLLQAKVDPNAKAASINWDKITKLSYEILSEESKDLLVACYLVIGLLRTEDIDGLKVGIEVLNSFVTKYWQAMYPPVRRINGRWSAFEWLQEQLSDYLDNLQGDKPKTKVQPLLESFITFDKSLSNIDESAPNFLPIIKHFEQIVAPDEPQQEAEQANDTTGVEGAIKTNTSNNGLVISDSFSSVDDLKDALKDVFKAIDKISGYLLEKEVEKPLAYRLSRLALWQKINQLPEYDQNYKTKVPPPDKSQIKQLQLLKDANNYQGVINNCQDWVADNPYWFDLHFAICDALTQLEQIDEASAIKSELIAMLYRFKEPLLKLTFADGMQMISEDVLNWLKEDSLLNTASDSANPVSMHRDNLTEAETSFLTALEKVQKSKKSQRLKHISSLQHYLSSDLSEELKIQLLSTIIECLVSDEQPLMLSSYIKMLEEKYVFFHIDQWDKNLASDILSILIKAKQKLNDDISIDYQKLCQINMSRALSIKPV